MLGSKSKSSIAALDSVGREGTWSIDGSFVVEAMSVIIG